MHKVVQFLRSLKYDLNMIIKGLRLISSIQRGVLPNTIITAVLNSCLPFVNIFMTAIIIDELLSTRNVHKLIMYVAITIGLNLFIGLLLHGLSQLKQLQLDIFNYQQNMKLNHKVLTMDFEHIEDPKVQLMLEKIHEGRYVNEWGIWKLYFGFDTIVKSLISIILSLIITFKLFFMSSSISGKGMVALINSPVLSIILVAFILASTYFSMHTNARLSKKQFKLMDKFVPNNRLFFYYLFDYIGTYQSNKDIKIYKQKDLIESENSSVIGNLNDICFELGKMNGRNSGINSALSSLLGGMVYLFVALKALIGIFSIGSLIKYTGSINQFISGFSLLMTSISDLRVNNQYLKYYFDFIELPDIKPSGILPVEIKNENNYEIEFRDVSFKYPGSEIYVLKNISMKIHVGERLAVVGMNGSGKTTFIKLLCRLYDPTEGSILLNGIDIKDYDINEYIRLFSVVFQDFKLFSFSAGQNVATSIKYDKGKALKSLTSAGLEERISSMPEGLETSLYKDFDSNGIEISGGEAQKIALARALYKDSPIIILDEPTAALDPIAEFEIYSKFDEIIGSKTAIYISHRLSSCRFCNNIIVFHEGQIIQRGNHDMLIQDVDSKYYELWNSQAQYYNEKAI